MKINVDLHMEKGVRINFSDEPDDYLPAVFTRIEGVRFINSPFWCVVPTFSENIIVRNVSFKTTKKSHNTDSVDIDSCKNCLIEDINVESSSDDCVVIKSGRDRDGLDVNWPTENVLVRNCKFHNCGTSCVVGSETSGGIRNVYMHDCECMNSNATMLWKICLKL